MEMTPTAVYAFQFLASDGRVLEGTVLAETREQAYREARKRCHGPGEIRVWFVRNR
jgi:type II secretory pathway component PulF